MTNNTNGPNGAHRAATARPGWIRAMAAVAAVLCAGLIMFIQTGGTSAEAAQADQTPPPGSVLSPHDLDALALSPVNDAACRRSLRHADEVLQQLGCLTFGTRSSGDWPGIGPLSDAGGGNSGAAASDRVAGSWVRIELVVDDTDAIVDELESMGAKTIDAAGNVVNASVAISDLQAVAAFDGVNDMIVPRGNANAVEGQHIELQGIAAAMAQYPDLDGSGVTVGIISDSFNCFNELGLGNDYALDVAQGELPPPSRLTVVRDAVDLGFNCEDSTDEIRGMAQVVFDAAPEATYLVHTGLGGKASLANAFRTLRDQGADVIIDDWAYWNQAIYQDDLPAQAVQEVAEDGVLVFTSAGNNGPYAFATDDWLDADGDGWLEFSPNDESMKVEIPIGRQGRYNLQWDDPYKSISGQDGDTDLQLYLHQDGNQVARSTRNNIGSDPWETLVYENNTDSTTFQLRVRRVRGPAPGAVTLTPLNIGNPNFEYGGAPTISGHSNSPYAFSAGAVRFDETIAFGFGENRGMSYSGVGGVELRFDENGAPISEIRLKPDAMFVHGMNTTFYGVDVDQDPDDFPNFFGTSAAAPNAGGIGVLIKQANPNATRDQVFDCLRSTAADMGAPGFDFATGSGYADGLGAIACIRGDEAVPPAPPSAGAGELTLGDAVTGLSGAAGSEKFWTVQVPAGASSFKVAMAGSGDADLYVRRGAAPTEDTWDCRPWTEATSVEECEFANPVAGTWHVMVRGWASYSNVRVTATTGSTPPVPSGNQLTPGGAVSGLSGSAGDEIRYTVEVPAGASQLSVTMAGNGDADVYVRRGSAPTEGAWDCRPWTEATSNETCDFENPAVGTWHVMVRGWAAFNNVSLEATIE